MILTVAEVGLAAIAVTWLDGSQETYRVTTYGVSDGQLNLHEYRRHGDQPSPPRRRFERAIRQVAWDELLNEWHIPLCGVRDWRPVHDAPDCG